MLCFDATLLGDYLDGNAEARTFLERHDDRPWAVSSAVLGDVLVGVTPEAVGGDAGTVHQAVAASMAVLDVTERTAVEAAALQRELLDRGVRVSHSDALVAASAREHGGTFATADRTFRDEAVRELLDVAAYDPC